MSTSEIRDQKDSEAGPEQGPEPAPRSLIDPLGAVLESFLTRFREGERPSLAEYVDRYPALADEIRGLFPALVEIEQLGSPSGAADPAGRRHPSPVDARSRLGVLTVSEHHDQKAGPAATIGDGAGPWPELLGDYRILGCVGLGGMGVVYEAMRESLKSRVALKVMHPRFRSSPGYLRRFHNEARSAAQLHHTNIVSVFDYGEQDGVCFYAMQFIAGHSLEEILADVRRLRSNQGLEECKPEPAGPAAMLKERPPAPHLARDPAETEAAGDPLMQTITHGLLTGEFARPAGPARDREEPARAATQAVEPGHGSDPAATRHLGFQLGRPQAAERSFSIGDSRAHPGEASRLSSSSLASQGDDHYHREIARLGAQVADALAYAHKRGVLHRDIKPSNLLLDAVGNVWVTDFGLAKFDEGEDLSQSQDVVGTLRYMAPERFRGVSDRRCDIYGLGATLYELLTLRPLFDGADRLRLVDQIVHQPTTTPWQIDRRIPRDLETIVQKALAKDPADRFATADELAAELRRFLENRPIRSRPVPVAERLWRWCRRNRAIAALGTLAAALTLSIAIGSTVAAWYYKASLFRAERAEHAARLALGKSLVSEGAALERSGLPGQRFASLDRLAAARRSLSVDADGRTRLPQIRDHAITALGLVDLRVVRQHDCGDVFDIGVDGELTRYAVAHKSGEIVMHRLEDGRELFRLPGPEQHDFWYACPVFSPDGEILVARYAETATAGDSLNVWHLGRRELLGTLSSPGGTLEFHPDGRHLLFNARQGGIGIWDSVERRMVRTVPLDFAPHSLALDPEGRRLAVNSASGEQPRVAILELETGRVLADWRAQVGNTVLAWSADGQLLAVGNDREFPRVFVWNVKKGALASVLQGHTAMIVNARFAHSGYLLATSSWDGTSRLWDAVSGELLATAPGNLRSAFAPDDGRLAFALGGKIGVWQLAGGAECRTLHPGMIGNRTEVGKAAGAAVEAADFSPDGRLVATADGEGVRLWEADTGREVAHLKSGFSDTVLFHNSGRSLITSSRWGLYRWPIKPDPDRGPDAISVGPPELLREYPGTGFSKAAWAPDERTLAVMDNRDARVWLVDTSRQEPAWGPAVALDSGENHRMTSIAISPDGRWLAVGGWKEAGIRVWDLERRRLACTLVPNGVVGDLSCFVGFSQGGRTLISSTATDLGRRSYDFWRVGTWEPVDRIDQDRNGIAFYRPASSADGRLLALGIAPDQVMLLDPITRRPIARLTTLQPVTPTPLVFSPDGTKLVAGTNQKTVLVWDLRRIREGLQALELDWDAPNYPPGSASGDSRRPLPPPMSIRVQGEVSEPQARRAALRAEVERRLLDNPDDADALIRRGWLLTLESKWPAAIADLEHGLRLEPELTDAAWLLGQSYLQIGNLMGALAAFSRLLDRAPEEVEARFQRGVLALALAQPGLAADDFSRVLAAHPEQDSAHYRRAQALIRAGLHREALADLEILIPRYPDDYGLFDLRASIRAAIGDGEGARSDRAQAHSLLPGDPVELNSQAWEFATGLFAKRDPDRALTLARRAVALAPGQQYSLNTLGVALYRCGEYSEAISVLNQSLAVGTGEFDAFDLFFLAMAHQKLGESAEARACFDRALGWLGKRRALSETHASELNAFRAEAQETLAATLAELPVDVFAPE